MSRGLRNNNPGNIRRSGTRFRGEVLPGSDPSFKEFYTAALGYRAMFVVLDTYARRYALKSIREMITRYAPPSENFTEGYIRFVARTAGITPDEELNTRRPQDMIPVVMAMSEIENGTPANIGDVHRGWNLFADDRHATHVTPPAE